jgi:hypothetical protein
MAQCRLVVCFIFAGSSYVVGHVLYHPSSEALPTHGKGQYAIPPGPPRWRAKASHPSDFILDAAELTYPENFKQGLQDLINERFKGDVQVNVHFDWDSAAAELNGHKGKDESKQRELAFLLCRSALATGKVASYGEQFQGLYEFLRCLTVVLALGFSYLGWALTVWKTPAAQCVSPAAVLAAVAIIGAAIVDRWGAEVMSTMSAAWLTIGLLMIALLLCPVFLKWPMDSTHSVGPPKYLLLASVALIDAFVGLRCFSAYKPFSWQFAKAIYRDFYVYAKTPDGAHTKAG